VIGMIYTPLEIESTKEKTCKNKDEPDDCMGLRLTFLLAINYACLGFSSLYFLVMALNFKKIL